MKITMTNAFKKAAKKLHPNQKIIVENAIEEIEKNTEIGEGKVGDLSGVQVYKFHIQKQLMLLAYQYIEKVIAKEKGKDESKNTKTLDDELILISLSSHQNFYRDLKNK